MSYLYTSELRREFGGLTAVNDVDLSVEKGSIHGLIGPNGAGKTTLFNNITGLDTPTRGFVFFDGRDITGLPAYRIARLGIARTFQNLRLFPEMTVLENIMIGRHFRGAHPRVFKNGFLNGLAGIFNRKREEIDIYENSVKWMEFFHLSDFHKEAAKNLPYGKQKELEIARALATEPCLLFLDEPAAGMNPRETDELIETIGKIRALGITVVLIEHDMKLVMRLCDRITVLDYGVKIALGTPDEVKNNPQVIEAYLGKSE